MKPLTTINQSKQIDIDLDGTLKREGIVVPKLNIRDVFLADNREFSQLKGQRFHRTIFSGANYSLVVTDYLVAISSLILAPTIELPDARMFGVGKTFKVKDEVGGAATTTITIVSGGERTIDGSATNTITTNYGSRTFYTANGQWFTC